MPCTPEATSPLAGNPAMSETLTKSMAERLAQRSSVASGRALIAGQRRLPMPYAG